MKRPTIKAVVLAAVLAFGFNAPVFAQNTGTVTNHAIPVGKGAGVQGFTSKGPCAAAEALVWADNTHDPVCTSVAAGGGVTSFNARTGAVLPAASDYNFNQLAGSAACSQLPALTGNVTSSAGTCSTVIGAGVITNSMVNASAAIAYSKLSLTSSILPGDVNTASLTLWQSTIGVRQNLTANTSFYVRTDGLDSNTCTANTAGGACLTLQGAWNVVAKGYDLRGYTATINIADGIYPAGMLDLNAPAVGGSVRFVGNTGTPGNVIIAATSGDCFEISGSTVTISGMKLSNSGGSDVHAYRSGVINISTGVQFSTASEAHIFSDNEGQVIAQAAYTINGNAPYHWLGHTEGYINVITRTVTLTGTPAFSSAFAYAVRGGVLEVADNTYTGSATGIRYITDNGGTIYTNCSVTCLPGDTAGQNNAGFYNNTSSGGGDFSGPASSTDNAIVRFDGTTGKLGQNSAVTIADTTGVIAGTQGVTFSGSSSGTVTLVPQAAAGTPTVTFGTSTGTPAVTASSPLAITTATGNITCATCATTTNGGALSGTSPIAISAGGVISLTNPLPVANGGTNATSASITAFNNITGYSASGATGTTSTNLVFSGAPVFTTSITDPLVIGGTAAGSTLTLQSTSGVGTTDQIIAKVGNNGGTEAWFTDTSGRLVVSSETTTADTSLGNNFQMLGTTGAKSGPLFGRWNSGDTNGPGFFLYRSRNGTIGSHTVVQSGDRIMRIGGFGDDGTGPIGTGDIYLEVDGTPGTNDMPGRWIFTTTPDGSATPSEKFRIDWKGHLGTSGTIPTVGTCGTSPTIATGGTDTAGVITTGSTSTTACTLTFANSGYTVAPICTANTTTAVAVGVTPSTTTLVFAYSALTSAKLFYHCLATPN